MLAATLPAAYHWDIYQTVENAGFQIQRHDVTTPDGYVLGMFRIMNDSIKAGAKAPAVFFQHGLFETGDCWLAHGP